MRFDQEVEYFNEKKERLDTVLCFSNDLGAEKQSQLFSAAGDQSNMKERQIVLVTDDELPIRSGYLKIAGENYTILKVIGSTVYVGEYHGKL